MKQLIHGKNIEVTPALAEYAEQKLGRLADAFGDEADMHVYLSVQGHKQRHIVEVTVYDRGTVLRAEVKQDDMYTSIDLAADKMERQLRKLKEKTKGKQRKLVAAAFPAGTGDTAELEEEEAAAVREKKIHLKPADLEEALLQMELLDHDFHLFHNSETRRTELVYRRQDGTYGHIIPV